MEMGLFSILIVCIETQVEELKKEKFISPKSKY